jgi:hypothetical protein
MSNFRASPVVWQQLFRNDLLPSAKAQQLLAERDESFVENLRKEFSDELKSTRRRIR